MRCSIVWLLLVSAAEDLRRGGGEDCGRYQAPLLLRDLSTRQRAARYGYPDDATT
jgi:hypothetical protein